MSKPQTTRAEIYARIKASSKQEVILEEMQRMGFWPKDEDQPQPAAEIIQREGELQRELLELRQQFAARRDPERALREMRKQRMQQARAQREETRRKHAEQRYQKALAWHAERATHIGYLGPGVSAGLNDAAQTAPLGGAQATQPKGRARVAPDVPRLHQNGLPVLASGAQLADAMGVSVAELRFLSFHREVARSHHYHSFTLPKKTGGERLISAPMPRLKRAQYWVLDQVLAKIPAHDAAHGFLTGRSIVSNALPHAGQDVVINLDVKDFFPSIAFGRIKGVFRQLGYGESVASILALLCSENRAQAWQVDGEQLFIGGKARERVLPQGAPTSPMLTNLLCRRLDRRLQGLAKQLGFAYTRYADDLTFSASGDAARDQVGALLRRVRWILRDEGFTPHPDKERVMRKGRRQEVTGLVVNGTTPSVSRQTRRQLRAALHRASQAGQGGGAADKAPHWNGQPAQPSQLLGLAQFVQQVDAKQGQALLDSARQLTRSPVDRANLAIADAAADKRRFAPAQSFREAAAAGQSPARANGQAWWQPQEKGAPVLEQTDQQRKEQRQQERRQAMAALAGQIAKLPPAAAAEAGAASAANQSRKAARRGHGHRHPEDDEDPVEKERKDRASSQFILSILVGWVSGSFWIVFLGIALTAVLFHKRKQSWPVFFAALFFLAWLFRR